MMIKRSGFYLLACLSAMSLSVLACFNTPQATQPPVVPPSATSQPAPTTPKEATATLAPIVTPTESPTAETPTQAATQVPAADVALYELTSFKDSHDYWYFYGLVRNDMEQAVGNVTIRIKLLDSAGSEIYSYSVYSLLPYLNPGEISPFSHASSEAYPDGSTFEAEVHWFENQPLLDRPALMYNNVKLWASDYDDVYMTGEIYNTSSEPALVQGISGALTDSSGKLVSASLPNALMGYLKPNAISPFVMEFHAPPGEAATLTDYNLYTDAVVTGVIQEYDLTLSETHSLYQDDVNYFHLVGSATNESDQPLNVKIVAGLYDKDWNCLDASMVRLPVPLNPGESMPYDFAQWSTVHFVPSAAEAVYQYLIFIDWYSTYTMLSPSVLLSTENDSYKYEGFLMFEGTVINQSGKNVNTASVSVALYDKSTGELIATNFSNPIESLPNGTSAPYLAYIYPPGELDMTQVNIVIEAYGQ